MATGSVTAGSGHTTVFNALVPPEGPKSIHLNLDFSVNAAVVVDFTLAYMQQQISSIQTVKIDNTGNATTNVTVTVDNTGDAVLCPPGCMGVFPLICAARPKITVASASAGIVPVTFLNVPLPAAVWGAAGSVLVTGTVSALVTSPIELTGTTSVPAVVVAPPPSVPKAGAAHAVTTGGTAVTVASAAGVITLNGGYITNPGSATANLYVDPVSTAGTVAPGSGGTTTELVPGQSWEMPPNMQGTITANSTLTGHSFIVVQW